MRLSGRVVATCVIGASLAAPGIASAATKNVIIGTPPSAQRQVQQLGADINDYFPHSVTIRKGDSVRFTPAGFHTVELLARGKDPTALLAPTGDKANVTDEAGQPFWFNGQDVLAFAPPLVRSGFGKRFTFKNTKNVNSGLPLAENPKPMRVKFTKTGNFTYICNLHPGMEGKVKVVKNRNAVPTKRADANRAERQLDRAIEVARDLPDETVPANTVSVGVGGDGGVELFAFVPAQLRVAPGTTVTFRMSPGSFDIHTATAGPGDPESEQTPTSYLGKLSASFQAPVFDPIAVYPSEPPGTVPSLTSTTHGNGFWNSGVMDAASFTPQLPGSTQVKFDTPGTFSFLCLIHPFMKGTVQVG